ncbi:hypothetical protein GCM10022252_15300 [Streptosporangium oxazolinicum]|uniref:Uncharacterized protein n=1 Tax=Streptosporangium oxazolinicum TaxID=909287 RepID=A0ABP8AKL4_9ACTN
METLGFSSGGETRYGAVRPGGVTGGDDTPTTVRMIDKILSAGPAERWNAWAADVGHDTSGFLATGDEAGNPIYENRNPPASTAGGGQVMRLTVQGDISI